MTEPTHPYDDRRLREDLRALPPASARAGFTRRVLARLDGDPDGKEVSVSPFRAVLGPARAIALAALLAVALAIPLWLGTTRPAPEGAETGESLARSHDVGASELGAGELELAGPVAPRPAERRSVAPRPAGRGAGELAPTPLRARKPPEAGPRPEDLRPENLPPENLPPEDLPPEDWRPEEPRLEELRHEQQQLAAEITALKRLADRSPRRASSVVYLGGDERTDLVLDLASLARRRGEPSIRPASYGPPPPH